MTALDTMLTTLSANQFGMIRGDIPTLRTPSEQVAYESRQTELSREKIHDDSMEAQADEGKLPWHRCPACGFEMAKNAGGYYCNRPKCCK